MSGQRRFVRFSVRGLIVLVLSIGAAMGWVVRSAADPARGSCGDREAGGNVVYESIGSVAWPSETNCQAVITRMARKHRQHRLSGARQGSHAEFVTGAHRRDARTNRDAQPTAGTDARRIMLLAIPGWRIWPG